MLKIVNIMYISSLFFFFGLYFNSTSTLLSNLASINFQPPFS